MKLKRKTSRSGTADTQTEKQNLLQRFSLFFFKHGRVSAVLWVAVLVFGVLSYTVLLQRQGFPSIDVPVSMVNGTYFVNNEEKVDANLARPMTQVIAKLPDVKTVTSNSDKNFTHVDIEYKEGVTSAAGSAEVQAALASTKLPAAAKLQFQTIEAAKFNNKYDLIVSSYAANGATPAQLDAQAQAVARGVATATGVAKAEIIDQYKTATDIQTGKVKTVQDGFDRVGIKDNGQLMFYPAVSVGITAKPHTDALKLYDAVQASLRSLPSGHVQSTVTADFAESIREQVSALQSNLAEGLIIVIIVSFLLISWRAGLATALSMATVLFMTVGALKIAGYTLNTITLFALILSLGLIVDDTTIVAEAIDAGQAEGRPKRDIVAQAVKRVARASLAGTFVTILTFAPMLFIGGILGGFIRALPVTIIVSLALSLVVSLSLIPFLARSLILGREGRGKASSRNPIIQLEHMVSNGLAGIVRRSAGHRARQVGLALAAFAISFAFLLGSFHFFSKLKFDIFPATKDGNQLSANIQFKPNTSLAEAQHITDQVNRIIASSIGQYVQRTEYLSTGSSQTASATIDLVPYTSRTVPAPQVAQQLTTALAGMHSATVKISQDSAGPPKDDAPFKVQVRTEDSAKATAATQAIMAYLNGRKVTRTNGTTATMQHVELTNPGMVVRKDGQRIFGVQAGFNADDVSTLVVQAKKDVQSHFTDAQMQAYGLRAADLQFDFGEEQQNQDSFKSMLLAFPVLLIAMFVLLAVFFRSLLQPVLIFMAIPFSFFGVAAGLDATNNPLSFFVMIGFFALIGIAVNNTIMLVDYANQARRAGKPYTEAMAEALQHRFRPLITTSFTSVVALTPLAMADPFWQPLAVTLIFGLLSSTFLVIVSFPYYWLAAEWLRLKTKRGLRRLFRRPAKA